MLSKEQIQSLFTFCRKHFVYYYDVQVELVDHLANAVELEMQKDSKISFERALEKIHKSFGVLGFAPLVAEKQKHAEKQSIKLFWKLLKQQFGWPKILIFFVLFSVLLTLFSIYSSTIIWVSGFTLIIGAPIIFTRSVRLQKEVAKTGKKFLIINFSWIGSLFFLPVYFLNYSKIFKVFRDESILNYMPHNFMILSVSIYLSVYIIAIITIGQTLTAVKNNLYQTYPEVFSVTQ